MMAVPGIALVLIGIIGLVSSTLPRNGRPTFLVTALAIMTASGTFVNAVISSFFADASRTQAEILDRISELLPSGGSALLVEGFCPYLGPAVVFETDWDLSGALQIRFKNPELRADVATPSLEARVDGIHTFIYDQEKIYPYGTTLQAVDLKTGIVTSLIDRVAAEQFFRLGRVNCPRAEPGVGVRIF
jgi:hypothetical protein